MKKLTTYASVGVLTALTSQAALAATAYTVTSSGTITGQASGTLTTGIAGNASLTGGVMTWTGLRSDTVTLITAANVTSDGTINLLALTGSSTATGTGGSSTSAGTGDEDRGVDPAGRVCSSSKFERVEKLPAKSNAVTNSR